MKILAISDTHGGFPDIPECDLLLIGGDISYGSESFSYFENEFVPWINNLPAKNIVLIAGNHDFVFVDHKDKLLSLLNDNIHYLENEHVTIEGLKIYGTPITNPFFKWAFMLSEKEQTDIFKDIDEDTDIILSHGPPYGIGDMVLEGDNVGSMSLRHVIERISPRAVVCGHIHEAYGRYQYDATPIYNVSLRDHNYVLKNKVTEIELGPEYYEI